ncbi:SDR family NAD(P)-dependent oxidoreductase [Epilithonimonas pallida]|uniref:SDR family NAD(P)-dependent oxidoreductase n=1 Tax=Epilithonimonas pallida TaxID=373671 RepID=UPI00361B2491
MFTVGSGFKSKRNQDSFDINVMAVIKTMQSTMPYFIKQKSGNIINYKRQKFYSKYTCKNKA